MPCAEERYAAGMIGKAATEGTERAPKEESFRHRHRRGGHRNFLPVPLQYSSLHLIPKVGLWGFDLPSMAEGRSDSWAQPVHATHQR